MTYSLSSVSSHARLKACSHILLPQVGRKVELNFKQNVVWQNQYVQLKFYQFGYFGSRMCEKDAPDFCNSNKILVL
jgi:hypothetical protein